MVQALINNIANTTITKSSGMNDIKSETNFQTLFDKQNEIAEDTMQNFSTEDSDKDDAQTSVLDSLKELTEELVAVSSYIMQSVSSNSEQYECDVKDNSQETSEENENINISCESDVNFEYADNISTEEVVVFKQDKKEADNNEVSLKDIVDEEILNELNVESIEADVSANNSDNGDIMQNQTPQEQGIKAVLTPNDDFSKIQTEVVSSRTTSEISKPLEITPAKIIEQITKQMEGMHNNSKVNIVLNPESLGKVSIQLINTKEGLSAQFTVATQEARNLIMKGLDGLKENLVAQGISIDNVSVKINDSQKSEYNADWTEQEGSRGGNKEQGAKQKQKEEKNFEQMMAFANEEENKV